MAGVTFNRVEIGDCRAILPTLPDGTFQTCVTSPPYFGLRDYGHADQIGLEQTPEAYVAELVAVFREVRRVLRDDGTLWLNLGDSYTPNQPNKTQVVQTLRGGATPRNSNTDPASGKQSYLNGTAMRPPVGPGMKAKDLMGIPWMVAFALRSDGWYLRSDIIWSKPNPMPESVTDRPTKAHEYLFLLSKSERYYYDAKAIAELATLTSMERLAQNVDAQRGSFRANGGKKSNGPMKAVGGLRRNKRSVWTVATSPYSGAHFAVMPEKLIEPCVLAGSPEGGAVLDPFFGSGTVGAVAERLGRRWFGCELNPAYKPLIDQRTAQVGMTFGAGAAEP